jgi:hypothetical protein
LPATWGPADDGRPVSVTVLGRDAGEIEALVTDRYLDALLAGDPELTRLGPVDAGGRSGSDGRSARSPLDAAVRAASQRLAGDLPRFHPSFRFEERLALRLAEAAAQMRMPLAAGSESDVARIPVTPPAGFDPLAAFPDEEGSDLAARPFIVRGAVAASAISLAGAAWFAWRHRPSASPMARAARAAHAHAGGSGRGQLSRSGRA